MKTESDGSQDLARRIGRRFQQDRDLDGRGRHLGSLRPDSVSSHPPDVTSCRSVQVSSAVRTLKYRWPAVRHWATTARISTSWSPLSVTVQSSWPVSQCRMFSTNWKFCSAIGAFMPPGERLGPDT